MTDKHVADATSQDSGNDDARTDGGHTPLRRAITGKLLFLFILGDVLGAGIYALVGEVAGEVGGAIWCRWRSPSRWRC